MNLIKQRNKPLWPYFKRCDQRTKTDTNAFHRKDPGLLGLKLVRALIRATYAAWMPMQPEPLSERGQSLMQRANPWCHFGNVIPNRSRNRLPANREFFGLAAGTG